MDEEKKRNNIEYARNYNVSGTFENHMLRLMSITIGLLADISETLLDMQKGEEHDRCGVKLTPENNKNGFELCDRCDKQLHDEIKADKAKREGKR